MRTVVREFTSDAVRAALPRAEAQIAVRFGETVELHAIGAREQVHRKRVRAGVKIALIRLPLGTRVLGAPAGALAGRIVPLAELWGRAACERIARAPDPVALVEAAVAAAVPDRLAVAAAERLARAGVREVAAELGVSERQLRRTFRDAVGVSPKAYARLARFHRAIAAARGGASWTRIAAATGYCDQAHLIDDFHAIVGATPRRFLSELADAV